MFKENKNFGVVLVLRFASGQFLIPMTVSIPSLLERFLARYYAVSYNDTLNIGINDTSLPSFLLANLCTQL